MLDVFVDTKTGDACPHCVLEFGSGPFHWSCNCQCGVGRSRLKSNINILKLLQSLCGLSASMFQNQGAYSISQYFFIEVSAAAQG